MAYRLPEDLREKRNNILFEKGSYYKILVNGQTEAIEPSLPEARVTAKTLVDEGIAGEGAEVNIRYSQVGGGRRGWHEPNIESYTVEEETLRLQYKKPTKKQYRLQKEERDRWLGSFWKEEKEKEEEEDKRSYALVPMLDLEGLD